MQKSKIKIIEWLIGMAAIFLLADFWALPNYASAQGVGDGCATTIDNGFTVQCEPWQKQTDYSYDGCNYTICASDPGCIQQPTDHWYFDDPVKRTRQKNDQEVTLPAGLAWSDAPGWHVTDSSYLWSCNAYGRKAVTSKLFGINSYIVEIDNTKGQLNESASKGSIFRYMVIHPYFNPTDGDLNIPCFFNSDTDIRWRVRPCAGEDGSDCESEDRALWWTFHTSPAPEPLTPKDPDWNGPNAAKNVDFCQATLTWCSAKVSDPKIPLNESMDHALSYQIFTHSNEAQVIDLNNATIPSQFAQYADWLKNDKLGYGPQETCHYLEKQPDGTCKAEVVDSTSGKDPRLYFSNYLNPNNDRDLFTKNITYYWQPRSCFNNNNAGDDSCQKTNFTHYGQKWKFTTASAPIAPPDLNSPPDDQMSTDPINSTPVGLPATISWKQPCGANSYGYQVQEVDGTNYKDLFVGEKRTTKTQAIFSSAASSQADTDVETVDLKLNAAYRWRVHSCWPSLPLRASDCEAWSPWYSFRTTGRAPLAESMLPANNSKQVTLPVALQWENVPGALSYIIEINGNNQIVGAKTGTDKVTFQITYPTATQNKTYHWRLRTCADANAMICGPESSELVFNTAPLVAATPGPQLHPQNTETIQAQNLPPTYNFSWEPVQGALYYHVKLSYTDKSAKETNKDCQTGEKANAFVGGQNSYGVQNSMQGLFCLGTYKWNVQACMDSACKDSGPVSADWTFTLAGDNAPKNGSYGLGVCGQAFNNPGTPWDEREACQPKHFFLELQRIINFILFTLALWTLPLLGVATGIIFYTSLGGQNTMGMVKSWWKAIGIGYALLFFAWIITTWLLQVFGFSGLWYKIF